MDRTPETAAKQRIVVDWSAKWVQVVTLLALVWVAVDNRATKDELKKLDKSLKTQIAIVVAMQEKYAKQEKKLEGRAGWAYALQLFVTAGRRWSYESQVEYARINGHVMPKYEDHRLPIPVLPEEIKEYALKKREETEVQE